MSASFENLEKSMVKIRMEVSPEDFEAAINRVYNKQKGRINVDGFRKGKAPRNMIEKAYGKDVFYEDAINDVLPAAYEAAIDELKLDVMARPSISIDAIEADKPVVIYATVATRPGVELCKYKSIKVAGEVAEVKDEEVEEELKKALKQGARIIEVEDAAELGDTVNIDFEGFKDGVAFNGGKGEKYDLKLGSGSFIPGFEDQLVGKKAGEACDVNVTFPEQYGEASLAGQPALFKVFVHSVKREELPEADDDFAKDYTEFETLAEYKESLKAEVLKRHENEAKRTRYAAIMDKIIEKSTMEIDDSIVEYRAEYMVDDWARNLSYQGLSIEQYMQYTGSTKADILESMKPEALRAVQEELVLDAIAAAEGIETTDEDVDAEIKKMAEMYHMEEEKLRGYFVGEEMDNMKDSLKHQKVADWLNENIKK